MNQMPGANLANEFYKEARSYKGAVAEIPFGALAILEVLQCFGMQSLHRASVVG